MFEGMFTAVLMAALIACYWWAVQVAGSMLMTDAVRMTM